MQKRQFITMLSGAMLTGVSGLVRAQGAGTPGVTDREIKIGSTGPLSGPAAGYGIVGKTMSAWFDLVNAEGGVNGRQLKLVLADDGYSPPKTLEQSRRLVERDQVAFLAAQSQRAGARVILFDTLMGKGAGLTPEDILAARERRDDEVSENL